MEIEQIKYVYDLEALKSLSIADVMIATGLWESRNNRLLHQEHEKKVKPKTNVFEKTNTCTCTDCGFHAYSPLDVAKHYKNGNFAEGLTWLAESFGIEKIPNPEYKPKVYEKTSWEKVLKEFKPSVPTIPTMELKKEKFVIQYNEFNPSKTRLSNIKKGYEQYKTLPFVARLTLIYTDIYNFSLIQKMDEKLEYFKNRDVNTDHKGLQELGFIPVERFNDLITLLKEKYPIDDLVEVRVLNDSEHSKPNSFALHYIKNGGVVVYPLFHIYQTNLVTGFMFRPTKPEKWMIESHLKEIQMSANDIYETLPFGFTNNYVSAVNAVKCVVEGGPDAHCCPERINGRDLLFISSPGAGNLKETQLGLLKGQTLRFMLDPDKAGRIGVFGSLTLKVDLINEFEFVKDSNGIKEYLAKKEELEIQKIQFFEVEREGEIDKCKRAGVSVEVALWDSSYGDLNDVKKLITKKRIPATSIEEFLTKFVTVKKIKK